MMSYPRWSNIEFSIVPRSLAGGCLTPPGRRDVTEKRILHPMPYEKTHSV